MLCGRAPTPAVMCSVPTLDPPSRTGPPDQQYAAFVVIGKMLLIIRVSVTGNLLMTSSALSG